MAKKVFIGRDNNGSLWLFTSRPTFDFKDGMWDSNQEKAIELTDNGQFAWLKPGYCQAYQESYAIRIV